LLPPSRPAVLRTSWLIRSEYEWAHHALIEIVYTVGGYTMTGLAINSFGIQLEPGTAAGPMK